jgi:hypothetical protein
MGGMKIFLLFFCFNFVICCSHKNDKKDQPLSTLNKTNPVEISSLWKNSLRVPWASWQATPTNPELSTEFVMTHKTSKTLRKNHTITQIINNKIWLKHFEADPEGPPCAPADLIYKFNSKFYVSSIPDTQVTCDLKKLNSKDFALVCNGNCEGGHETVYVYKSSDGGNQWKSWGSVQSPWYMATVDKVSLLKDQELELTFYINVEDLGDKKDLTPLVNSFVIKSQNKGKTWIINSSNPFWRNDK